MRAPTIFAKRVSGHPSDDLRDYPAALTPALQLLLAFSIALAWGLQVVDVTTQLVSYWLAIVALTGVLIWGLKLVSRELQRQDSQGRSFLARALSESEPSNPAEPSKQDDPSFSRVAGALGAVGVAATFVGIGYWVIYGLFSGNDLKKLSELGTHFLAGSALFLPYAFNRIASIFKS